MEVDDAVSDSEMKVNHTSGINGNVSGNGKVMEMEGGQGSSAIKRPNGKSENMTDQKAGATDASGVKKSSPSKKLGKSVSTLSASKVLQPDGSKEQTKLKPLKQGSPFKVEEDAESSSSLTMQIPPTRPRSPKLGRHKSFNEAGDDDGNAVESSRVERLSLDETKTANGSLHTGKDSKRPQRRSLPRLPSEKTHDIKHDTDSANHSSNLEHMDSVMVATTESEAFDPVVQTRPGMEQE